MKRGSSIARAVLAAAWFLAHYSFLVPRSCLAQNVITTVTGSQWVFRGDGGPAVSAPLGPLPGVAVDAAGNVYAIDSGNDLLVKIAPNGILTVVAGNGIRGFSGDGGPATSARLNEPRGVAVDPSGNLYIADNNNNRIRKVSTDGTITTVAGSANQGYSGDAGPATSASLNRPYDLAVDAASNLYIVDNGNGRIRRVSASGTITTVAGNGQVGVFSGDGGLATNAALNNPWGVAVDGAGNLYIAEPDNFRVRKVSASGIITTVAGIGPFGTDGDGGPATAAGVVPFDVAVDSLGNLYITHGARIRKISTNGIITTVVGNGQYGFSGDGGPAINATLSNARSVVVDAASSLYIADIDTRRVRKVSPNGIITTIAGNKRFRFAGDGGPAASASLNEPWGAAVDATGNLYIADNGNQRVRKVAVDGTITTVAGGGEGGFQDVGVPATSVALVTPVAVAVDAVGNFYVADLNQRRIRKVSASGTITTVAGNGGFGTVSGDGGPATSARLVIPWGVAVDSAGNVYIADRQDHRVRKVGLDGIITTVAGSGVAGFAGDGGSATNALLNEPLSVALDATGNLYIAEAASYRVRRVNTNGMITTVAGNGQGAFSGDGGQATSASLLPASVAVDRAGNLYIAESARIRKVSANGIITTVVGKEQPGFSGDGGLATDAELSDVRGVNVDAGGNLYIAEAATHRIRKVLAVPPSFSVLPASLSVTAPSGTDTPVTRQIAVASEVIGLAWTAQATESWLSVSPASGAVPGIITASVDTSALAPGAYRGTITVTAPLALPTTRIVAVDLTVTQGLAPQLKVEPGAIVVEIPMNTGNPPQQALRVTNAGGGGTLRWTAQSQVLGAGNWLGVLSTTGSASGRAAASIPVRINVAGLQPGVYSGLVEVNSSEGSQSQAVPVTLLLSQPTKTILTTQRGMRFTTVEGSRTAVAQSLGIVNTGQGTMDWTVQASTLAGGSWLSATPSSGQSQAGPLSLSTAGVQVNPAGLPPGSYSGFLRVNAPGANNSPYLVTVELEVLPAGSTQGVQVRPPQLIFTALAGTSSPSSQTIRLTTPRNANVEARSGLITLEGGNWIEVLPSNLVLSSSDPRSVVVQPTLGNLAPGVHRGALTFQFSDGSEPQVVEIIFLVVGTTASAASRGEATACTQKQLIAADQSLGKSFAAAVGSATPLDVRVLDDCANTVTDATVVATFSNGDPPLTLTSTGNGGYAATWRPVTAAEQVTVMIRPNQGSLPAAEIRAQGKVQSNDKAPALFAGGIVNAASFAPNAPLGPGSIISVFGRNLAGTTTGASSLPLPKTLAGATLQIGGIDVPLFFASSGQINAQLPFELQTNTRQQVVVRGTSTITVPETITIAPARPGVFTLSQDGKGQGAILDSQGRLVDANTSAAAGDVVAVYATGLGATLPAAVTGEPASSSPLSLATTAVTATVGGLPASVPFAGLAPGFVGLYQVNVQIPTGVAPGTTQLVLLQNGVPSNTVTLAVR